MTKEDEEILATLGVRREPKRQSVDQTYTLLAVDYKGNISPELLNRLNNENGLNFKKTDDLRAAMMEKANMEDVVKAEQVLTENYSKKKSNKLGLFSYMIKFLGVLAAAAFVCGAIYLIAK